MTPIEFLDLEAVYDEIGAQLEDALLHVCRSGRYVGGEEVARFEQEFAEMLGARHAIGTANGTDALELALRALGVGRGDEVLVPANTFIATAEAVCATGAIPRFVDVLPDSGLIDLDSAESRLTRATRAIIPVHIYGRLVDMVSLTEFAARHELKVIEDAAQAHGAHRDGRFAGAFGDAGCFSFYPSKNLGALGDAGAVLTNDDGLAEQMRLLSNHGRAEHDLHVVIGRNSRLDALQAAALRVKLGQLERWTAARRRIAEELRFRLERSLLDWAPPSGDEHAEVHYLFPILHDERDALMEHLRAAGIACGIHYRSIVPDTPAFGDSQDSCPVAQGRARRQLSLPLHPHLRPAQVDRIVATVNQFLDR